MSKVTVFDNGGSTQDRYTIIVNKSGDVYGASDEPFSPNGIAQFNHNCADTYWITAFGASWRKHCDLKKCIRFAVNRYINHCTYSPGTFGRMVPVDKLPDDVQKYIVQISK